MTSANSSARGTDAHSDKRHGQNGDRCSRPHCRDATATPPCRRKPVHTSRRAAHIRRAGKSSTGSARRAQDKPHRLRERCKRARRWRERDDAEPSSGCGPAANRSRDRRPWPIRQKCVDESDGGENEEETSLETRRCTDPGLENRETWGTRSGTRGRTHAINGVGLLWAGIG